jgi:hypothetical protein
LEVFVIAYKTQPFPSPAQGCSQPQTYTLLNKFYDEIYGIFFQKDLLKLPDVVSGYYVDHDRIKVSRAETRVEEYRFGVANTLEQAKGIQ